MAYNSGEWSYDELDGDSAPRPSVRVGGSREPAPTTSWRNEQLDEARVPLSSHTPVRPSRVTSSYVPSPVGSGRPTTSNTNSVPARSMTDTYTGDMLDLLQGWPPASSVRNAFMDEGRHTSSGGDDDGDSSLNDPPVDGWGLPPPLSHSTPDMSLRTPLHPTPPDSIPPVPRTPRNRPKPLSPSALPNAECGSGRLFGRVDMVMRLSKSGDPYLSLPDVFRYVTFGGRLTIKGRMELGDYVASNLGHHPSGQWPKVTIDSVWNPETGRTNEISIRQYGWEHYPRVAAACLMWFADHKDSVVY